MFNISKFVALILAFSIGILVGVGAVFGGIAIALNTFTVRDLERKGIPIPDENLIGENPQVDLLDLTALEYFKEIQSLGTLGNDLTLNYVQQRYALIINESLNNYLNDDARNMPLKQLLTKEGFTSVLSTVYFGQIEQYQCKVDTEEGTVDASPTDENSYWVTAEGKKISPLEEKIADFTLGDFLEGKINTDNLINDLTIGDILGYTKGEDDKWYDNNGEKVSGVTAAFAGSTINTISDDLNGVSSGELLGYEQNEDGKWYDSDSNKVSGILSVFAGCSIDTVDDRMKTAMLAELLGYEQGTDGWYNGNGEKLTGAIAALADCHLEGDNSVTDKINTVQIGELLGYEFKNGAWHSKDESGALVPVSGFMNKIASKNMSNVDGVFNTLVLSDVVTDRTGILSIIPADTGLNNIDKAVTETIKTTPLQYFINEGLIQFDNQAVLDTICIETLTVDLATYEKYYKSDSFNITPDANGKYTIKAWRAQSLSNSYSYIVGMLTRNS